MWWLRINIEVDAAFGPISRLHKIGAKITDEEGFDTNWRCVWVLLYWFPLADGSSPVADWPTEFALGTPGMCWASSCSFRIYAAAFLLTFATTGIGYCRPNVNSKYPKYMTLVSLWAGVSISSNMRLVSGSFPEQWQYSQRWHSIGHRRRNPAW